MKADAVLQVPGKGLQQSPYEHSFVPEPLASPFLLFLGPMAEILDVQESDDFPVTILFLENLLLLMRALCFWFA